MADQPSYLDFDLRIERLGNEESGYRARVLMSPAGEAAATFQVPFKPLEVENFLLRIGRPRRLVRRNDTPELESIRSFGGRLYDAVFTGEVRGCLRSSLEIARSQDRGLRIRLRLNEAPELADLPWEILYNPVMRRFFALSSNTPVVRYVEIPESVRPLSVAGPVRILVAIAAPINHPALNIDNEWAKVQEAVAPLERSGAVILSRLDHMTVDRLQQELAARQYHVFHFIGHGAFDEQRQDGILVFEDAHGRGRDVSAEYLGILLHDHRTIRLAVLNSCEGARSSTADVFAGTAQTLLQQGLPAVIAMQFEITDAAAISIARYFYAGISRGSPIDAALAEARKAIWGQGNALEWATPVLYLRAQDGRIFDVRSRGDDVGQATEDLSRDKSADAAEHVVDLAGESWLAYVALLILGLVTNFSYSFTPTVSVDFSYLTPLIVLLIAWKWNRHYALWAGLIIGVPAMALNLILGKNFLWLERPFGFGPLSIPHSSFHRVAALALLGYLSGWFLERLNRVCSGMPFMRDCVTRARKQVLSVPWTLVPLCIVIAALLLLANMRVTVPSINSRDFFRFPPGGTALAALILVANLLGPHLGAAAGAFQVAAGFAFVVAGGFLIYPFNYPEVHSLGQIVAFGAFGYWAGVAVRIWKAVGQRVIDVVGRSTGEMLCSRGFLIVVCLVVEVMCCLQLTIAAGATSVYFSSQSLLVAVAALSAVAFGWPTARNLLVIGVGSAVLLAIPMAALNVVFESTMKDWIIRVTPLQVSSTVLVGLCVTAWVASQIDVVGSKENRFAICVGAFALMEAFNLARTSVFLFPFALGGTVGSIPLGWVGGPLRVAEPFVNFWILSFGCALVCRARRQAHRGQGSSFDAAFGLQIIGCGVIYLRPDLIRGLVYALATVQALLLGGAFAIRSVPVAFYGVLGGLGGLYIAGFADVLALARRLGGRVDSRPSYWGALLTQLAGAGLMYVSARPHRRWVYPISFGIVLGLIPAMHSDFSAWVGTLVTLGLLLYIVGFVDSLVTCYLVRKRPNTET